MYAIQIVKNVNGEDFTMAALDYQQVTVVGRVV